MVLYWIRWLFGIIAFRLSGTGQEQTLVNASESEIALWHLHKKEQDLCGYACRYDYFTLARCAKKAGATLAVTKRMGAYFLFSRIRKRLGLIVGFALFCGLLAISGQFLWEVRVVDYDGKYRTHLEEVLAQKEIHAGTRIKGLDIDLLQQELLSEMDEISWLALNVKGTVLEVLVSEKDLSPSMQEKFPCNVVARKAGQILRIDTYRGADVLSAGEVAAPGDLLVSGVVVNSEGVVRYEHADAKVIATTQDTHTVSFALTQQEPVYTGETKERYTVRVLGLELPLFVAFDFASPYEKKQSYEPLRIFNTTFAIGMKKQQYRFYKTVEKNYTKEQAKRFMEDAFEEYEQQKNYQKILSTQQSEAIKDGVYTITRTYECEENIAMKVTLPVQPAN